jgi:hypothetical protein
VENRVDEQQKRCKLGYHPNGLSFIPLRDKATLDVVYLLVGDLFTLITASDVGLG